MPVSGLPHLLEHTCFLLERSPGVIPRATCLLQPGPCLQTVTLESPGESQPPPRPHLCSLTGLSHASPPSIGRSWPVSLVGICSSRNGGSRRTQDLLGSLLGPPAPGLWQVSTQGIWYVTVQWTRGWMQNGGEHPGLSGRAEFSLVL